MVEKIKAPSSEAAAAARLGPSNWYFALYGPGKQSYHVEWAGSLEFGSQPVTLRFKVIKN